MLSVFKRQALDKGTATRWSRLQLCMTSAGGREWHNFKQSCKYADVAKTPRWRHVAEDRRRSLTRQGKLHEIYL